MLGLWLASVERRKMPPVLRSGEEVVVLLRVLWVALVGARVGEWCLLPKRPCLLGGSS
jgi:hypothetical protein